MSLFDSVSMPDFGTGETEQETTSAWSPLSDLPDSQHFVAPCGDSPTAITLYLLAGQARRHGSTIERSIPKPALVRHCKRLLEQYQPGQVKLAVRTALAVSTTLFSFKFVEKLLLEEDGDATSSPR